MIFYFFSNNHNSQLLDIEAVFDNVASELFEIRISFWRPGRYQRQNFSKNLLKVSAFDTVGNELEIHKTSSISWEIITLNNPTIHVKYQYYANEIDAGNSLIKGDFWKINPINLILFNQERLLEKCSIILKEKSKHKLAISATYEKKLQDYHLHFSNFYEMFDTPFLLGNSLKKYSYQVSKTNFNIWIEGFVGFDTKKMLLDFKRFTKEQFNIFKEFPFESYNFYIHILPESYYHGVEHANSTLIILGPDSQNPAELYHDLLGISSHELFHAWNICKIRPLELLTYDFTKETYFKTCFVAEGFTTFYGDSILNRSEIFDSKTYLKELETCYRRHFETSDAASQSLLESSYDLWVDGYERGIPNRKVSVYHKGAIAAQALDILIRAKFHDTKSLDDVLRMLWQKFGNMKNGYTYNDIIQICESIYEESLKDYFDLYIESNQSIFEHFKGLLKIKSYDLSKNNQNTIQLKSI